MSYSFLSQTLQMHLELLEFSISYWNLYDYHYERQISYTFLQFYLQPKVQAVPYIFHIVSWTYQLILNVFHSLKMEKNNLTKCLRCPIEFEAPNSIALPNIRISQLYTCFTRLATINVFRSDFVRMASSNNR